MITFTYQKTFDILSKKKKGDHLSHHSSPMENTNLNRFQCGNYKPNVSISPEYSRKSICHKSHYTLHTKSLNQIPIQYQINNHLSNNSTHQQNPTTKHTPLMSSKKTNYICIFHKSKQNNISSKQIDNSITLNERFNQVNFVN